MKKIIAILLALTLTISLSACNNKKNSQVETSATTAQTTAQTYPFETVIDASDDVLEVPEDSDNITVASTYAVVVPFLKALQITENVVAINAKTKFWTDTDGFLDNAGTVGRGVVDLEALATFEPTLFINRAFDDKTKTAVENLGIEYMAVHAETIEDTYKTLTMLGDYFGASERANEVITYMEEKFAEIAEIVSKIPEDEKVSAFVMGGQLGSVAGQNFLQSEMIELAGGISLGKEYSTSDSWAMIGVEEIFANDPDFLFTTASTVLDYSIEKIYGDDTWGALKAVLNENIYQIPAKIHAWDLPGVEPVIGTFWLLHKMYPEYFSANELQAEIDEYYTFIFGETFDSEYLGY